MVCYLRFSLPMQIIQPKFQDRSIIVFSKLGLFIIFFLFKILKKNYNINLDNLFSFVKGIFCERKYLYDVHIL